MLIENHEQFTDEDEEFLMKEMIELFELIGPLVHFNTHMSRKSVTFEREEDAAQAIQEINNLPVPIRVSWAYMADF